MKSGDAISLRRAAGSLQTPLVRSSAALIASSLLGSAFGFLYWIVAGRAFPAAEVGLASAIISSMTLVTTLSLCGLNQVSARFLPVAGRQRRRLTRQIQFTTASLGAIGGALFVVGGPLWGSPPLSAWILFVAGVAIWSVFTVQDGVLLGLGYAGWVPMKNGLFGLAKLGLLALAARSLRVVGINMAVATWFISMVFGAALVWWIIDRVEARSCFERGESPLPRAPGLARFALVNHIGAILLQLPPLVYPILVLQQLGQESTAYFYTAWMIANLLMLATGSIATAMVTQAVRQDTGIGRLLLTGVRYALVLVLPGAVAMILFGRLVLSAFGSNYVQGYDLLVILACGCPLFTINAFYAGLMRVRRRLTPVLLQGGIAGVVSFLLAWPLGAKFGLPGFGLAFVAGQACAIAVVLVDAVRAREARKRRGASVEVWS